MNKYARIASLFALFSLFILLLPMTAGAIVEPGTEKEYEDTVTVEAAGASHTLNVTGIGLREKTFMKVNVYVIVSYLIEGTKLEG